MEPGNSQVQVTTVTITGNLGKTGNDENEVLSETTVARDVAENEDEAVVSLLQTQEQQHTFRRLLIVPNEASSGRQSTMSNRSATSTSSVDTTSFTVPNDRESTEYREFTHDTLQRFYGDVTPYGTVAKRSTSASANQASDDKKSLLDPESESGSNPRHYSVPASPSPSVTSPTFVSTSVYTTLLRTSSSGPKQILLKDARITYIDFLPEKVKKRYGGTDFKKFGNCIEQANIWLQENKTVKIVRCETVRHRLDHSHRVNPESSTSHDRSWLVALRLWLFQPESDGKEGRAVKIGYRNVIPSYKELKRVTGKTRANPPFEDLKQTLQKLNESLSTAPLPGKLLTIESLSANYATVYRSVDNLDVDCSYYCLEFQGNWDFCFIRLFYFEDEASIADLYIDAHDVIPAPVSFPPSKVEFQPFSALVSNANRWLAQRDLKDVISLQTVELPFKAKLLEKQQGCLDTHRMNHASTRYSVHRDTIRVMRIWLKKKQQGNKAPPLEKHIDPCLQVKTFVPTQLTTTGCCGMQRAIFATTHDTVKRISEWVKATGVEIIDIETNNVEKWSSMPQLVEEKAISERCYNKEDHKTQFARSALEYRLNMYRVYYRPNAFAEIDPSPSVNPVKPCCCFVGCSVM